MATLLRLICSFFLLYSCTASEEKKEEGFVEERQGLGMSYIQGEIRFGILNFHGYCISAAFLLLFEV